MNARNEVKWIWVLMMTITLLSSCQKEQVEIRLPPAGTTITGSSTVAKQLSQVASRDGSVDNLLDKSSCISLTFPVTVKTNGQTILVNSIDDLDEIENLFDNSGDDEVDFIYPIQVILPDHTEVVIKNETEFNNVINTCQSDDDIECIDFVYPIQFNTYDANNQVAGTITIDNDKALYNFIRQLEKDEIVGIKFPVTLTSSAGVVISVNDFDDLEDAIEDAADDCDEDDDNDYNDDDVDDSDFVSFLTAGSWQVESFVDDGTDRTSELTGFAFTFNSNKSVTAVKTTTTIPGIWATSGDSGEIELLISMSGNDPFDDISEDWTVITYSATSIRLEKGDDDDKRILIFKKI